MNEPRRARGFGRGAIALMVGALALAGCQGNPMRSGPGVDDACSPSELPPSAVAPNGVAQAAQASGGQRASNQPTQMDPGARNINTVWNRGAGATTSNPVTTESRSQAGAPSVNQGLIIPASAENSAGGGTSAAVQVLTASIEDYREQYRAANARGDAATAERLGAKIDGLMDKLLVASSTAGTSTINNNFQNSKNFQSVANGSNSGGEGGAINPKVAEAMGKPLEGAARAIMAGPETPVPPEKPAPVEPVDPVAPVAPVGPSR